MPSKGHRAMREDHRPLEALRAEPAASRLPTSHPTLPAAQRTTLGVGEAVI